MTRRDYTKEVGISAHKTTMSRPLAYGVLALVAVGVSFGVAGVLSQAREHEHAGKKTHAPASRAAASAVPAPAAPSEAK
jgi:hypothetical protein